MKSGESRGKAFEFFRRSRNFIRRAVDIVRVISYSAPAVAVSKKTSRSVRFLNAVKKVIVIFLSYGKAFALRFAVQNVVELSEIVVILICVKHREIQIVGIVFPEFEGFDDLTCRTRVHGHGIFRLRRVKAFGYIFYKIRTESRFPEINLNIGRRIMRGISPARRKRDDGGCRRKYGCQKPF